MQLLIKGIITGFIIVLPGMSGGTLLLLLGVYEKLVRDLSRLRLLPWLPFILGGAGGILLSGVLFSWLLGAYTNVVSAFLLGSILASVRAVLGRDFRLNTQRIVLVLIGGTLGFLLASEPMGIVEDAMRPGVIQLLIGGALACTTMMLPGVPGSSILIMMGIYDDMFQALADLDWVVLLFFALGAVLGVFGLSNALDKIYARHKAALSWLFAGMIIGSARMLIPVSLANPVLLLAVAAAGFALVWWWGGR